MTGNFNTASQPLVRCPIKNTGSANEHIIEVNGAFGKKKVAYFSINEFKVFHYSSLF